MLNLPKISIIVPVFNSEPFLVRCMDSLIRQTFKNIEIIAVDDCSCDGSKYILEDYSKKNSNFNVIFNKKNSGVSASRNIGIRAADSDYILFCDSDDYLEYDACEKLYKRAIESDSEFVFSNYNFCIGNKKHKNSANTDSFMSKFPEKSELIAFAPVYGCGFLIRKELFFKYDLFYEENLRRSEELPTTILASILAKNTTFVNDAVYNYVQNPKSISNEKEIDTNPFFVSYKTFVKRFEKIIGKDKQRKYTKEFEFRAINVLLYSIVLCKFKNNEKKSKIIEFINDFQKEFPNWTENSYIKKLGIPKRLFLFFIKHKLIFAIKFMVWLRQKIFSC